MIEKAKCCLVMFDEMYLSCHVHYNRKDDCINGIENGGIVDDANVFMIQGVYSKWKQPVCFTFSSGSAKSGMLKNMLTEVIKKCQEIGLHVVATVCDQGTANQAAINSLLRDSEEHYKQQQKENRLFGFLVNNVEIVPLYDVPHLFKGIRNNLLQQNLHFKMKEKEMVAKWNHIVSFYYLDTMQEDRTCSKLTDQHVLKESINKMKVSTCMHVFSHQVGSIMKMIATWASADRTGLESGADTAELILFFDKLFDSLNSNTKTAPSSKPLKGGLRKLLNMSDMDISHRNTKFNEVLQNKAFVTVP